MVATQDHHIDPGAHWSAEPDFAESWPVHCKVGTDGEAFHPNLDPQPFDARVKEGHASWLVVYGNCTHLGCVPLGNQGAFNGWFCPCHGSVFDTAGRIRQGPAPINLPVPPYTFVSDTRIRIGEGATA